MLRFALFRPTRREARRASDGMEIDRDNDPIRRPTGRHAGHFLGYVSRSQAALNKLCANWNWIESGQLYRAIAVPRVTTHDRLSGESWAGSARPTVFWRCTLYTRLSFWLRGTNRNGLLIP